MSVTPLPQDIVFAGSSSLGTGPSSPLSVTPEIYLFILLKNHDPLNTALSSGPLPLPHSPLTRRLLPTRPFAHSRVMYVWRKLRGQAGQVARSGSAGPFMTHSGPLTRGNNAGGNNEMLLSSRSHGHSVPPAAQGTELRIRCRVRIQSQMRLSPCAGQEGFARGATQIPPIHSTMASWVLLMCSTCKAEKLGGETRLITKQLRLQAKEA